MYQIDHVGTMAVNQEGGMHRVDLFNQKIECKPSK